MSKKKKKQSKKLRDKVHNKSSRGNGEKLNTRKKTGNRKETHKRINKSRENEYLRVFKGVLKKHKRGFGFVQCEELDEDIFIPKSNLNGAMNGDEVIVGLLPELLCAQSMEGEIISIEKHAYTEVVGLFQKNKGFGFVVPADKSVTEDVFIDKKYFFKAKPGDYVVAKIIRYPSPGRRAEGRITKVINKQKDGDGEINAILLQKDIKDTFPSRAAAQAAFLSKQGILPEDIEDRRDLREWNIVTIDGRYSKDFDDGVSCTINEDGTYRLGVHIADVAHYVKWDDFLDKEALKRGNSIYLLDKVVPMLPFELSNGICSLNPKEDRLTLTCLMDINSAGEVINYEIFESIICSKERLVYDDVSDILEEGDEELTQKYSHILDDLNNMKALYDILVSARDGRGSIEFESDEPIFLLDDSGVPIEINLQDRRTANKLIEEFMLKANEVVASHFEGEGLPFLYRVHGAPEQEKLEALVSFMAYFGVGMKGSIEDLRPKQLAEVLAKIQGEDYARVINDVMLKTMQKAYYDTGCKGHFGLALQHYCHFTSPIRRYSDLFIHRIIKEHLNEEQQFTKSELQQRASRVAEITSIREREAIELERDITDLKMCRYAEKHLDEEFSGIVSGVTNYGIYVQLENTLEGMVRLENIEDDYYEAADNGFFIEGRLSKNQYCLGDRVKVEIVHVDPSAREIDMILV